MTQLEGFCTLFFVFLCRASGSTPAYSPPDSSYAATLHALTTVRPEIPAVSSHKTCSAALSSVYQGGILTLTINGKIQKEKEKKKQCANDRSHHWPEKQTDNSKLIIKIRKSFYFCTGLLCMRKDALRNSRLSVSPRVRREKIRSKFKIIAVVRTDQLNCSRVSANEQSNVFCFFFKIPSPLPPAPPYLPLFTPSPYLHCP